MNRWLKGKPVTECDRIKEWLSPYQDEELDPSERQAVETHLKGCPSCQAELDSLRKTIALVQQIPVIKPTRSFVIPAGEKVNNKAWNLRLKALSRATALVGVILLLIYIGDTGHYFDAPPLPPPPFPQPAQVDRYFWPVRETEFGLLGTFVGLAVYTFFYWLSRRRKP